jgi:hypothetical protein
MAIKWVETTELFPVALKKFETANILLDIGCGIMPQTYIDPSVHICCEPFPQYVNVLQEKIRKNENNRSSNYVVLNMTWSEVIKAFPKDSVDTVILVDVIEHLEKKEALDLLKQTEFIARHQILIFTPLGFLPQSHPDGRDAWGLDGGAWQEHKSGWLPDDFDSTWEIIATKVFHTIDVHGREFDTPHGAFWAVKTKHIDNSAGNKKSYRKRGKKIHDFVDKAIDLIFNK